jgi:hypothetical protein
MSPIPFCVVEEPYMVWAPNVRDDNEQFLKAIDADLYLRVARNIIGKPNEGSTDEETADGDQDRKDVSTLSRLLWHHGMETLVMLLGAYVQAPSAVHAYFLKCKTEDAVQIGNMLLCERLPKYHRVQSDARFSLISLLNGIHQCVEWQDRDASITCLARALRHMLCDYVDEKHRWEYNSIKHGLRASHGRFSLAAGIEEKFGVPPTSEAMQLVGYSRDSSFFNVAKPLESANKKSSKIHFAVERVGVTWSLERVLMELQLLSLLLHNCVSALRIVIGTAPGMVKFETLVDDAEFWDFYFSMERSSVPSASFGPVVDTKHLRLPTEQQIFDSYKLPPT